MRYLYHLGAVLGRRRIPTSTCGLRQGLPSQKPVKEEATQSEVAPVHTEQHPYTGGSTREAGVMGRSMGSSAAGSTREVVRSAIVASFLGSLPEPLMDAMYSGSTLHHVVAGEVFVDDSEPDWVGIMVSGLARVYLDPPDGPELTVRYVRPGGAVGVAALAGAQHPVSVRAITACRVLQLELATMRALVEREPSVGRAVARELAARLFDTYGELATRIHGTVRQRLAGHLLEVINDNAGNESAENTLTVTGTHEELAEAIGSHREVVSKALAAFAHEGVVQLGRGRIRLIDPVRLHLVAHNPLQRRAGARTGPTDSPNAPRVACKGDRSHAPR
jgi:CRP/FNR family transcriptional regulator, cyclic AMP receptor protein